MSIAHVGGRDLFYEEKGSGAPIVLVPPAGTVASTWGDVPDAISSNARAIVYDRRGYRSPAPTIAKKVRPHADDLIGLIETLDAAPVTLAGISVGATIALDALIRRPDLVRGAVLYEPPFHGKKHPDMSTIGMLLRVQSLSGFGRKRHAAGSFLRWAYAYTDGGSAWDAFPEEWRSIALDHARLTLADLGMATAEYIKPTALARVQTPIACAYGARSRRSMGRLVSLLAKAIPTARLVEMPGASHAAHFDAPKEFATLALETALGAP